MTSTTVNPPDAAPVSAQKFLHWILTGMLGIVFAAQFVLPEYLALLEAAMLVLAVAVSITALNRQIPLQNVMLGIGITAFIGGAAHGISALRGLAMPFGPIFFHEACGGQIVYFVPWTVPLLWIVALFSSRGTARVILRPWRKLKSYGYWLIGLTAVLITAFDFAFGTFRGGGQSFLVLATDKNSPDVVWRVTAEFLRLGGGGAAHPRFCHADTHQKEAGQPDPAGFESLGTLAGGHGPVCGWLRQGGTLAGGRRGRGNCHRHPGFCDSWGVLVAGRAGKGILTTDELG